ncbi:MAG: glycosyltransferase [Limnothrix sp. RL_2_0]|nr:glycosyltransferase [Limnothrix sp. RL_2_0]
MRNHLIIFTRYPIPGTTKTRLIPALGAAGAADLQRQLTEHTLEQVVGLAADISIFFSGGNQAEMQTWLGEQWHYQPQKGEGLGDRLINAFHHSETLGYERTLIIGIDCPEITGELLTEAFSALESHDAVFGKAHDGGYYLVGLQTVIPELFTDMPWGTETVLAETLNRANSFNLSSKILRTLHDIDYPEDLAIWEQVQIQKAAATKNAG